MASRSSNVNNLLQSLSSTRITEELESRRNEPAESMQILSSQTPNMVLQSIQGECKRNADLTMQLCESVNEMKNSIQAQQEQFAQIISSLNDLTAVLASTSIKSSSGTATGHVKTGGKYYYKGSEIKNRYQAIACVICHLTDMVYLHMDSKRVRYPDGTSPDFVEFVRIVQTVCKETCLITSVQHGAPINAKGKSTPVMESIFPYIGTAKKGDPVTLTESSLSKIYNNATREDIFAQMSYIMERLTHLRGILPPRQIDAIKCIGYPVAIKDDEDDVLRLNYDETVWKPRPQHTVSNMVFQLQSQQKTFYVAQLMAGKNPPTAYASASKYKGKNKKVSSKNNTSSDEE